MASHPPSSFDLETQQQERDIIKAPTPTKLSSVYAVSANQFNLLNGVGILSAAYAIYISGYLSLIVFGALGLMSGYAAYLLSLCMEANGLGQITSYQDISDAAFGFKGRYFVTTIFYFERVLVMISYTILLGSSLSELFPHASLKLPTTRLTSYNFLSIISILSILPAICAKSLKFISFFSLAGIFSVFVVVGSVFIDRIKHYDGIHSMAILSWTNLPFSIGFYSCGICANVVIPTVYRTMKDPSQFKKVILVSFSGTILLYGSFGLFGALLYGSQTQSPITLSMVKSEMVWKLAMVSIILSSITKLPLNVSSAADEIEAIICKWASLTTSYAACIVRISVRCVFMILILALSLSLPYFSEILALTGSTIEILMSIILPCIFYLKLYKASLNKKQLAIVILVVALASISAVVGTISSVQKLIERKQGKKG